MESSVFFDLKLRDFMSGGLQKVRAASASVFGGVGKDLTGVEKKTAAAATVMGRLRNALREMGSTASTESSKAARGMDDVARAATKAERSIRGMNRAQRDGGGGGGSIGGGGGGFLKTSGAMMLGSLAAQGVMMAAREVKEVVMSSLEKGMDAEQSIIGLQTFVGKSRARSIYTDLQKQAVMTPFTTADMLPVEMGLVATGMSPEKANKDMMNLMNAVSATGNAGNSFMFQLMGSHMAQAASGDKIDGQLLREFQKTAHIPVMRLLANDLYPNLSVKAGMKKVNNMDAISYDQFSHALERAGKAGGMFAGAMEAQSQTIRGKWSTIRDYIGIGEASAVLNPKMHANIIKLEDSVISGLKDLPQLIDKMQPVFSRLFDEFNELLPHIKSYGSGLLDLLKPLGRYIIGDDFKSFAKNVLDLGHTLSVTLQPAVVLAATALGVFTSALGGVISLLNTFLSKGNSKGKEARDWGLIAMTRPLGAIHRWLNGGRPDIYYSNPHPTLWSGSAAIRGSFGLDWAAVWKNNIFGKIVSKKSLADSHAAADATSEQSDAIVGGGQRVVNINFRNFTEHFTVHANGVKEGADEMYRYFEDKFLRVLASVPTT